MVENVENVEIGRFRPKNTVGFGINDIPIWLYRELDTVCNEKFNNQRWVMLLDLYRKAQAYELIIQGLPVQQQVVESDVKDEKAAEKLPHGVMTFSGLVTKNG